MKSILYEDLFQDMCHNLMMYIFERIPLPPTDNHMYKSFVINGKLVRAKSREYREYIQEYKIWELQNLAAIKKVRQLFNGYDLLDIYIELHLLHSKIWTKDDRPKKFDGQNRTKSLLDAIANSIGIDDRNFWKVSVEKVECDQGNYVNVAINKHSQTSHLQA